MRRLLALALLALITLSVPADDRGAGAASAYLKGHLLVAAPRLQDPYFGHTVVLMVRHDANGAFGLVINKDVGHGKLGDLLAGLGMAAGAIAERDERVFWGGPVSLDRLFVLHSADYAAPHTQAVTGRVSLTADTDILAAMAEGRGPKSARFVVGYSGWGPGQLEAEFAREDWLTVPDGDALVFDGKVETIWQRALKDAGLSL